jgi:glycosyltransferase involved in cell wall biosynthesis
VAGQAVAMSARPRLLLIAPTVLRYVGGTETVVAQLARRLARAADLTLATGDADGPAHGPPLDFEHRRIVVPFSGRDTASNRRLARWLGLNPFRIESRSFFRALDALRPDLAAFDAILTFYEHDAWLLASRAPGVRRLHLLPGVGHRRFFRRVDPRDVVFVGTRGAERARRKWGLDVAALPLGVDDGFFPERARERPGSMRLAFVGRLDGSKRIDWLADTFAASDLAARGYALDVVGEGPLGEALARRHRGTPGLVLHGRLAPAEVAALLQRARLLLHPTELESFGLSILEAMAAGTPVITHDLPAIRAWAGDHPTYAAHLDATAWLDAVRGYEDEARWAAVAARNLAFARGFGWDAIAGRVLALLEARRARG